jgi:hypothetical protein
MHVRLFSKLRADSPGHMMYVKNLERRSIFDGGDCVLLLGDHGVARSSVSERSRMYRTVSCNDECDTIGANRGKARMAGLPTVRLKLPQITHVQVCRRARRVTIHLPC